MQSCEGSSKLVKLLVTTRNHRQMALITLYSKVFVESKLGPFNEVIAEGGQLNKDTLE